MSPILKYALAMLTTALVVGGATYYTANQRKITDEKALDTQISTLQSQVTTLTNELKNLPSTNSPTLSNDQIFQESATQLGLSRSSLIYFRIYGQDRIQYSTGTGTTFAYKVGALWSIAGQKGMQSVADCNDLSGVPEKYRPPCSNGSSNSAPVLYTDNSGASVNYSPSEMISYIGK